MPTFAPVLRPDEDELFDPVLVFVFEFAPGFALPFSLGGAVGEAEDEISDDGELFGVPVGDVRLEGGAILLICQRRQY